MTTPTQGSASGMPHPMNTTPPPAHDAVGHGPPTQPGGHGHGGHGLTMLICCIPMVLVAFILITTGAVGSAGLLWALGCVAMMAAMMFAMPGGHNHK